MAKLDQAGTGSSSEISMPTAEASVLVVIVSVLSALLAVGVQSVVRAINRRKVKQRSLDFRDDVSVSSQGSMSSAGTTDNSSNSG